MVQGLGGAVEYQRSSDPHFHGNVHVICVYQHHNLEEIAKMVEDRLLTFENIHEFQRWVCREEHMLDDAHQKKLDDLEAGWAVNYRGSEHHRLCQLPAFIAADAYQTPWTSGDGVSLKEAEQEGRQFTARYYEDAQFVFSRCQHHWHPKDGKSGERMPIHGCKSKKNGTKCRHNFPLLKKMTLEPKVVCPGNCRRYGLRVSGRRNALGSLLTRRTCPWFSGTTPSFAVAFRSNTNTSPNYRVPLLQQTHDPDCKSRCLHKISLAKMMVCAQRAQHLLAPPSP